jgi:hypothetical protein
VSNKENALKLRLIAAVAEDMANKLERNGVWPGELSDAVSQIYKTLGEIKEQPAMTATTSKLGADMTDELAENIARHCGEASILAGNEVCKSLMVKAADTIRVLLARQPAAIDKETECNCASNPHAEGCPVTAHVRAMFAASGESAYGAAPLDKEGGKPAPSVEQDERGACIHADEPKACYRVRCQLGNKCVDDDMSPRAASTSANVSEPFPYQKTFNAIAAATEGLAKGQVSISVLKFREAFGAANVAQGAEAIKSAYRKGFMAGWNGEGEAISAPQSAPPAQTALADDARDAVRRAALEEAAAHLDGLVAKSNYLSISPDFAARQIRALAAQSASGDTK